jgi:ABC-type transporter Mla subunit MlaD
VLRRLAYQQGGTSLADHFRRLKRSLADASDDLAAKSAEAEAQEQQLQELRAQLNAEAARHRKAVARACTLAQELEAAKAAVHRVDAATQLDSAALSTDQGIALEKSKPAATAASRANTANNRSRANGAEAEQPVAGGAAAAVAAADAALQLPIYSTHNSSSSSSWRSAPQSAEPWRDPFGGDYAATSPEDQHADEANGSSGNNRQERDSSWWPFQGKSPQKVGGRLVLQV